MDTTPVIVGFGLQTPVGLDLMANVAAVRSGLNAFRLSETLRGYRAGERLKVSRLSTLASNLPVYERMVAMAHSAAQEALCTLLAALPAGTPVELPVVIAVPGQRPGFPADTGQRLFKELVTRLPVRLSRPLSAVVTTGNDGGLAALDYATRSIRAGTMDFCLLGGVDSYMEIDTLHWLEAQDRLKLEAQPHGFIPGEGASFALLCSRKSAQAMGLLYAAEIVATGRGEEQRLCFTGLPNLGDGLTQAFRAAFASEFCPPQKCIATYSDLNGESWRAEEWGYAFVKMDDRHSSPIQMRHPAANWGDLGAASGAALLALASVELIYTGHPQDIVSVWASSDWHPSRSVCIVRRASGGNA